MDAMELLGMLDDDDDDDLAGYGDDLLGAARRPTRSRFAMQRRAKVARAKQALVPQVPGVPATGVTMYPLGFGVASFTASSGTALTLTARPQRPFLGSRLVISVARTGASATGLVTITNLLVGQNNQLVSATALPAEAFQPGAFDVRLKLDPATPGIDVIIGLAVSVAPTASDQIDVSAVLIGASMG